MRLFRLQLIECLRRSPGTIIVCHVLRHPLQSFAPCSARLVIDEKYSRMFKVVSQEPRIHSQAEDSVALRVLGIPSIVEHELQLKRIDVVCLEFPQAQPKQNWEDDLARYSDVDAEEVFRFNYPNASSVNRCPACTRVVRAPEASQCLWCGHDWHKQVKRL